MSCKINLLSVLAVRNPENEDEMRFFCAIVFEKPFKAKVAEITQFLSKKQISFLKNLAIEQNTGNFAFLFKKLRITSKLEKGIVGQNGKDYRSVG